MSVREERADKWSISGERSRGKGTPLYDFYNFTIWLERISKNTSFHNRNGNKPPDTTRYLPKKYICSIDEIQLENVWQSSQLSTVRREGKRLSYTTFWPNVDSTESIIQRNHITPSFVREAKIKPIDLLHFFPLLFHFRSLQCEWSNSESYKLLSTFWHFRWVRFSLVPLRRIKKRVQKNQTASNLQYLLIFYIHVTVTTLLRLSWNLLERTCGCGCRCSHDMRFH